MNAPRTAPRFARTVAAARRAQERLKGRVVREPLDLRKVRLVGAADVTFIDEKERVAAAIVVVDMATGAVVEERTAALRTAFPYVPGFLAFREGPAVAAAWGRLSRTPDAMLYDGHGIAHPVRFGIACHMGVLFDVPSVGCAKSRLVGEHREPGPHRGDWSPLVDDAEVVGAALRTREGAKPVFVSVGHRCDLAGAIALVLAACSRYRLPDPARRAHELTRELRAKR